MVRKAVSLSVVLVLAALVGASINLLWTPAQNWWAAAPQTLRAIERKARPISQFMSRVEVLTNRAFLITLIGTGGSWFFFNIATYGNAVSQPNAPLPPRRRLAISAEAEIVNTVSRVGSVTRPVNSECMNLKPAPTSGSANR